MRHAILGALMALVFSIPAAAQWGGHVTLDPNPPMQGHQCDISIDWDDYPSSIYGDTIDIDWEVTDDPIGLPLDWGEITFTRPPLGDPQTTTATIDIPDDGASLEVSDSWGKTDSVNILINDDKWAMANGFPYWIPGDTMIGGGIGMCLPAWHEVPYGTNTITVTITFYDEFGIELESVVLTFNRSDGDGAQVFDVPADAASWAADDGNGHTESGWVS